MFSATLLLPPPCPAAELYVSPVGRDSDSGTRAKPFATLERARDEGRRLKQDRKPPRGGLTIWLGGGEYLRTNAFELTVADSGEPDTPIIWRACEEESVRLIGGRRLRGLELVSDPAVLERLAEAARTQVRQVNLKLLGISDFGQMRSHGFGRALTPAHCELFYNGRALTLARWPNSSLTSCLVPRFAALRLRC